MAVNGSLFLINKMPGKVRVAGIYFSVGGLDLLFVFLDRCVFIRVNEAGFKEKIPQGIQIHVIANIGIFIFGLMQHGDKFEVITDIHVQ